jgi:mono/diheme cytochrome c family protein
MLAIHQGKGRMPGFPSIDGSLMQSLLAYLKSTEQTSDKSELSATPQQQENQAGAASYAAHCAICHGDQREGIEPSFPALLGVGSRMNKQQMLAIIHDGKGRMPGFHSIPDLQMTALLNYLGISEQVPSTTQAESNTDPDVLPYQFTGYRKFLDQDGYPAIAPPWGTLSAVDLNTGKYLWKIPLGEYPELAAKGMTNTGTENYGGPIVTAGGLVIIGATVFDKKIRAFDSHSGKLLWSADLPYSGMATPITYMVDGKQYIVIATGGGRDPKSPSGGEYVAFALP